MTISYIGSGTNNSSTVTIPTHAVGDLILITSYHNANSAPTPPAGAGWFPIVAGGSATGPSYFAIWGKWATATNDASGTWSNGSNLTCAVYRGVKSIGGFASAFGSSATANYPALTMVNNDGTSWVFGAGARRSSTFTTGQVPSGVTQRGFLNGTPGQISWDTNGGVSSWSSANVTITSSGWATVVIELSPYDTNALSPFDKSASLTLSNSNLTIAKSGTLTLGQMARANLGRSTGKYIFKASFGTAVSNQAVGFTPAALTPTGNWFDNASSGAAAIGVYGGSAYLADGTGADPGGYTYGTTSNPIWCAIDLDNKLFWYYTNGVWSGAAPNVGNPDAGTGGWSYTSTGAMYPTLGLDGGAGTDTITFDGTAGTIPVNATTFKPWDGNLTLSAAAGSFALTGEPVALTKTGTGPQNYSLLAGTGTTSLTGEPINLTKYSSSNAFDTNKTLTGITFSNNNLTAGFTGNTSGTTFTTYGRSTGRYVFAFTINTVADYGPGVGFAQASFPTTDIIGSDDPNGTGGPPNADSVSRYNVGNMVASAVQLSTPVDAASNGDKIFFAVDMDAHTFATKKISALGVDSGWRGYGDINVNPDTDNGYSSCWGQATWYPAIGWYSGNGAGNSVTYDPDAVGHGLSTYTAWSGNTGSNTGTATVTLPGISAVGAGTLGVSGSGISNLTTLSSIATGILGVNGTGLGTLAPITAETSGTISLVASGISVLPAITVSAAGVLGVTGTGISTLGAFVVAASGQLGVAGTAVGTFAAISAIASGDYAIAASGTAIIPAIAVSASGKLSVTGTGIGIFASLIVVASGVLAVSGSGIATLSELITTASGRLDETGTGIAALPALQVAADGKLGYTGTGIGTIANLIVDSSGTYALAATGIATLPVITVIGDGRLGVAGIGGSILPAITTTASGNLGVAGNGIGTLPQITAVGTASHDETGEGLGTLPQITAVGIGSLDEIGSGNATLPSLTAVAEGTYETVANGISVLPTITVVGAGRLDETGTGITTLPQIVTVGVGKLGVTGTGISTLSTLVVVASGASTAPGVVGDGAAILPALMASASGRLDETGVGVSTLPTIAVAASGVLGVSGSGVSTLAALLSEASGTFSLPGVVGEGVATLPIMSVGASGRLDVSGSAFCTLPTLHAVVNGVLGVTGSATGTLPAATAEGNGVESENGIGIGLLPTLVISATGRLDYSGDGVAILPPLFSVGTATFETVGTVEAILNTPIVIADGFVSAPGIVGFGSAALPQIVLEAFGLLGEHGSGTAILPQIDVDGVGTFTPGFASPIVPIYLVPTAPTAINVSNDNTGIYVAAVLGQTVDASAPVQQGVNVAPIAVTSISTTVATAEVYIEPENPSVQIA